MPCGSMGRLEASAISLLEDALIRMSLEQLDAFLALARRRPDLDRLLHDADNPLDFEAFLALARTEGFNLEEGDVIAAQLRSEEGLSDAELQERAAVEARRLRHFIPG